MSNDLLGGSSDQQRILGEIFNKALSGKSVFKNPSVLRPDYIPPKLLFRDKQLAAVGAALSPLLRGQRCSNLLLYGKTGTGKTAVALFVLRVLRETAVQRGLNIAFAYCNTRLAGTEYRVLMDLGEAVGVKLPFTGLALNEAYARIVNQIASNSLKVVLVLDEVDFLVKNFGDDLLYEFTRSSDRFSSGSLSLVGISNDLRFKEFLDPRVLSSLSEEELVFPPYTVDELRAILTERASMAFIEGAVSSSAINLCAALAGSEHGDARRAVDLLRVAGEMAEREGVGLVEEKHVRLALQKMEQDRVVETLRSLPLQAKIVLVSVVSSPQARSTGEVYETYTSLCKRVGIDVLTQRRVSGLLSELDLQGIVSANIVNQGRRGRTKRITSLISPSIVKEVFQEDPILASIL